MIAPKHNRPRGVLYPKALQPMTGYWRYFPSPDLAPFVEHYWTVEWDLSIPQIVQTLPHPSVHLVLEPGVAQFGGVSTKRFSRVLEGKSRVVGAKFLPGGFRPFVSQPLSDFSERILNLSDVFGAAAIGLDARVLQHADHVDAIAVLENFLREREPRVDTNAELAGRIVACIAADRQITKVEQLVDRFAIGMRRLQRLFGDCIGASPKWVIQRYRLHESAERLAAGEHRAWTQMALDLGYADQAHFIRDFKKLVGKSPAEYVRSLSADA